MLQYGVYGWLFEQTPANGQLLHAAAANWSAIGFILPAAKTLSKVRLFQVSTAGTVVATDARLDIYDATGTAGVPGSSLANKTADAAPTNNTWLEWSSYALSLSANTQYWAVTQNLNAVPASNNFQFRRNNGGGQFPFQTVFGGAKWGWTTLTSTNSGSTWGFANAGACMRLEFGDGTFLGYPLQSFAAAGSAQGVYGGRKNGVRFTSPSSFPLKALGVAMRVSQSGTPTVGAQYEVYEGTTLVATTQVIPVANLVAGTLAPAYFASPYAFKAGQDYRVVLAEPTNADTSSNRYNLAAEMTVDSNVNSLALKPFAGTMQRTYWDGSAWTETSTVIDELLLLPDPAGEFAASSSTLEISTVSPVIIHPLRMAGY